MRAIDQTWNAREALQGLYRTEVRAVHGYLLARSGSRQVAEDLTSETFVSAADLFARGRGDEVSGAWLMTVAKRRLIDYWRRAASHRERVERLGREVGVAPRDDDTDAEDVQLRVLTALESLPERHRAALTLRYLDEHSVSEVAELLGLGYSAAESLLARARRGFVASFEERS